MLNRKEAPKKDINDDINWDYEFYQGRSRRQVTNNENLAFYSILFTFVFLAAALIYLVISKF